MTLIKDTHIYGTLTNKEKEFLRHVSNGLNYDQIAEAMNVKYTTVRKYAQICNQKMQTDKTSAAARTAKRIGQL